MKKFIFAIFIFASLSIHSIHASGETLGDWKVIKGENGYYIRKKDLKVKMMALQTIGGEPEIIKVEVLKEAPRFHKITYRAGSAGTTDLVTAFRAIIYDLQKNEFIADLPLKYESELKKNPTQPSWKFNDGILSVYDESSGFRKKINLK